MDDVAHDRLLSVAERGDRALIGKFEGQDLTHPWAGNVIDLCPVGALPEQGLAQQGEGVGSRQVSLCFVQLLAGCNMIVETRDKSGGAPASALERGGEQVLHVRSRATQLPLDEFAPIASISRWYGRTACSRQPIGRSRFSRPRSSSPASGRSCSRRRNLSNESLFLLSKLVRRTNGAGSFRVNQGPGSPLRVWRNLALRPIAPPREGAELAGFTRADAPLSGMQPGDVLVVADEELAEVDAAAAAKAGALIVIGTTLPAWARHGAAVVLPISNCVEEEGTFTNLRGRVQRFPAGEGGAWSGAPELLRRRRSAWLQW